MVYGYPVIEKAKLVDVLNNCIAELKKLYYTTILYIYIVSTSFKVMFKMVSKLYQ